MPRPEGQRCLVIASRQNTISRTRSGSILHSFPSPLPGGSKATHGNADTFSILDTIFSEPEKTYFVLDVMAWNGCLLYDCTAEFRTFWAQSKLAEIAGGESCQGGFSFVPVPLFPCNPGEKEFYGDLVGNAPRSIISKVQTADMTMCMQRACKPPTQAWCHSSCEMGSFFSTKRHTMTWGLHHLRCCGRTSTAPGFPWTPMLPV